MKIAHMDPGLGQEKAKEGQALRKWAVGSERGDRQGLNVTTNSMGLI